ncbi:putative Ran-binding protein [Gregarina niphandrodes]|uniref:Ran-binding protein n=1 Tax=Gregarina niphandrodes TaxID=110365 RepID=A0A023B6W6_GRENI|nr:putative Ran-binding protein [Gregarina niphandrodes]EZG66839.1 putative Ran-binding protein [Gregarina niphandrodes]|eukprot:XP_011130461.1 putative Ran-binding protein [Gregarina niphandrodes]
MEARPRKAPDWTCGSCSNVNFAKRHRCNKCGEVRPKNGAATPAAESRPLRQGDWLCPGCQNVNWARRDKCNLCLAMKPTLLNDTDTKRTGRAGGHYDIQDPQDRLAHDSGDEEYDEFGRRKKAKTIISVEMSHKSETTNPVDPREALLEQAKQEGIILTYPPAPMSESEDEQPRKRPRT